MTNKITKRIKLLFLMIMMFGFTQQGKSQISSTGKTFYMSFMEMETRNGGYPDTLLISGQKDLRIVIPAIRTTIWREEPPHPQHEDLNI